MKSLVLVGSILVLVSASACSAGPGSDGWGSSRWGGGSDIDLGSGASTGSGATSGTDGSGATSGFTGTSGSGSGASGGFSGTNGSGATSGITGTSGTAGAAGSSTSLCGGTLCPSSGYVCVSLDASTDVCEQSCTVSSQCLSTGCCASLQNGGGACLNASYCQAGTCPNCDASYQACVDYNDGTVACGDQCSSSSQCGSGCCGKLQGVTYGACTPVSEASNSICL